MLPLNNKYCGLFRKNCFNMKELQEIQKGLHVAKTKKGTVVYNYRTAEEIIKAVKPLLAKHGCALKMDDYIDEVAGRVYVRSVVTLVNSDGECVQAQSQAREPESLTSMVAPQISGACSSYARKYALCGLFAIDNSSKNIDEVAQLEIVAKTAPDAKIQAVANEIRKAKDKDELITLMYKYSSLKDISPVKEAIQKGKDKFNTPKTKKN